MSRLFLILATLMSSIHWNTTYAKTPKKTIVIPYQLTGNVDVKLDDEHKQRLTMANTELRKGLQAKGNYDLVDEAASKTFSENVITALNNNDCKSCEAKFAKPLNAKYIIAPYVFKLSQLVLTMHFVILDADTGKIILKKALDFRGDNDQSWQRAITYFLKNLSKTNLDN